MDWGFKMKYKINCTFELFVESDDMESAFKAASKIFTFNRKHFEKSKNIIESDLYYDMICHEIERGSDHYP